MHNQRVAGVGVGRGVQDFFGGPIQESRSKIGPFRGSGSSWQVAEGLV